jgi:hypothetical protein
LERSVSESGNFHILWDVPEHGRLALATASLVERPRPYSLPVELARGAVHRLRSQISDWQIADTPVPDALEQAAKAIASDLSRAVSSPNELDAADLADMTLRRTLDVGDQLIRETSQQILLSRRQKSGCLPTLLGGTLPSQSLSEAQRRLLSQAWNSAVVPFSWRVVEQTAGRFAWDVCDQLVRDCRSQGWKIVGGPLLDLGRRNLPDWTYLWEDDFEQLRSYSMQFLRAAVERYRGKVHIWNCAARMNVACAVGLTEEQRLRLVVTAIDEVRRLDPQTPILVSIDQPWAEYLATASHELSPIRFADSLVRADLGVAGLGLELNTGYWPGGTLPRDAVEFSRQLDRWSACGLPLIVFLTIPSGEGSSNLAQPGVMAAERPAVLTPFEGQERRAEQLIALLLAKHYVQGVYWNQFADSEGCEFVTGGLFDAASQAKPVLRTMMALRERFLA